MLRLRMQVKELGAESNWAYAALQTWFALAQLVGGLLAGPVRYSLPSTTLSLGYADAPIGPAAAC
jgi:hypothetical protein